MGYVLYALSRRGQDALASYLTHKSRQKRSDFNA